MSVAMVATGGDPGHAPARRTYEKLGFRQLPLAHYARSTDVKVYFVFWLINRRITNRVAAERTSLFAEFERLSASAEHDR